MKTFQAKITFTVNVDDYIEDLDTAQERIKLVRAMLIGDADMPESKFMYIDVGEITES